MRQQESLIERVRELCHSDPDLRAALMYGSFAQETADEHSDIEFWLFFDTPPDPVTWCARIAPFHHHLVNESGTVVVFFPGLIRGEFHFGQIEDVSSWPARSAATDRMIVVDRDGSLRAVLDALPATPAVPQSWPEISTICGRFANWLTLAWHVHQRGEYLRALDALSHAQRCLLWMARLAEQRTQYWLTPSRQAEADLPRSSLTALTAATSSADPDSLAAAIAAAWACGRTYWTLLASAAGEHPPSDLFRDLDAVLLSDTV